VHDCHLVCYCSANARPRCSESVNVRCINVDSCNNLCTSGFVPQSCSVVYIYHAAYAMLACLPWCQRAMLLTALALQTLLLPSAHARSVAGRGYDVDKLDPSLAVSVNLSGKTYVNKVLFDSFPHAARILNTSLGPCWLWSYSLQRNRVHRYVLLLPRSFSICSPTLYPRRHYILCIFPSQNR